MSDDAFDLESLSEEEAAEMAEQVLANERVIRAAAYRPFEGGSASSSSRRRRRCATRARTRC